MVIMIAVMVVVTVYTAGALTSATSGFWSAGLTALSGSAVAGGTVGASPDFRTFFPKSP